jgi:hypothetical protein
VSMTLANWAGARCSRLRTSRPLTPYSGSPDRPNGIENFWSLLKRGLKGTYVCPQPYHPFRYIDERAFTFNERELSDLGRAYKAVAGVSGKRVTYKKLTSKETA